jgi:hypothetical protein
MDSADRKEIAAPQKNREKSGSANDLLPFLID